MTNIELLASRLTLECRGFDTRLEEPEDHNDFWRVRVSAGNRNLLVEWKPQHTFKIYDMSDALTPKGSSRERDAPCEEVCEDIDHVFQTILSMMIADII